MKTKKLMLLLFCFAMLIGLCACSGEQTETVVTYDSLTEDEQAVIDLILSNRGIWGTDCTDADFTTYDGKIAFFTAYYHQVYSDEYAGWNRWYSFDVKSGTFEEIYSRYGDHSSAGRTLTYTPKWYSTWSQEEKQDYLAQKYMEYLDE